MKSKLLILALTGTLLSQVPATTRAGTGSDFWPTNSGSSTAGTPGTPMATTVSTNETTTAAASETVPTTEPVQSTAPVIPAAVAVSVPAVAIVPVTVKTNALPVAGVAVPVPLAIAVPPLMTNAPSPAVSGDAPAASIPLIEFQDVPLTVAIENLARQAGINYLLDPKIAYGQPDQNGQVKAEPTLSIRWENVTAREALVALLNNYDLQMIDDPKTKIARISVKDPTAPPPLVTRVLQLKYAGVSNMVQSVQAAFTDRRSHVFPDARTSQLIVVATESEQTAVDTLINDLDMPTRQVLIETKLLEVSSTPSTTKGVNWAGTLQNQNVSFGNGVLQSGASTTSMPGAPVTTTHAGGGTTTTTPSYSTVSAVTTAPQPSLLPGGLSWNTLAGLTPAIGFLNADGVQAVLSFLNQTYDAQTLSTPRVVTLDNEQATIAVTRQFPVINVTASTAGVSSGSSSITYSNIGTVLEVTPRITANDFIWLKVIPDVSSFFATVTKQVAGQSYQADEFDSRHIETQVMIPNGNTLVMGGLIQDNPTAAYTQVPVLASIPVLGWAFKSQSVSLDKENLVIFITPTIVRDSDFQPANTDFLASRPNRMQEPMNPNNIWDRPESDWSNPAPAPGEFRNTSSAQ